MARLLAYIRRGEYLHMYVLVRDSYAAMDMLAGRGVQHRLSMIIAQLNILEAPGKHRLPTTSIPSNPPPHKTSVECTLLINVMSMYSDRMVCDVNNSTALSHLHPAVSRHQSCFYSLTNEGWVAPKIAPIAS